MQGKKAGKVAFMIPPEPPSWIAWRLAPLGMSPGDISRIAPKVNFVIRIRGFLSGILSRVISPVSPVSSPVALSGIPPKFYLEITPRFFLEHRLECILGILMILSEFFSWMNPWRYRWRNSWRNSQKELLQESKMEFMVELKGKLLKEPRGPRCFLHQFLQECLQEFLHRFL